MAGPVEVEELAARLVHPLVHVCTEVITHRLEQVGGEMGPLGVTRRKKGRELGREEWKGHEV